MILRERYMNRIRPFIGSDLIKVMTGMRRSGKSVMLELIREELLSNGVSAEHCITINFEDMRNSHLCTAAGTARRDPPAHCQNGRQGVSVL